jgi:hypothetical protein
MTDGEMYRQKQKSSLLIMDRGRSTRRSFLDPGGKEPGKKHDALLT